MDIILYLVHLLLSFIFYIIGYAYNDRNHYITGAFLMFLVSGIGWITDIQISSIENGDIVTKNIPGGSALPFAFCMISAIYLGLWIVAIRSDD